MVKVFLDTNKFIDSIYRNTQVRNGLSGHMVYVSPLSVHILYYTEKIKVPSPELDLLENDFIFVDLTNNVLALSLQGPTSDLEDNIQLHSCAEAECDYFLTSDDKLLKMKFFCKTRIVSSLPG